jgi:hypothetical protein
VGLNYILFGQYPVGAPYAPPPGYGTFETSLVNSGIFASDGVTTGEFGTIQSLDEGPGAVTLPSAFMTFDTGGSNLQLWATRIPAGNDGIFNLTNTPDGAVLSFDVDGYILDTTTGRRIERFTGTFAATFDGESVATLLEDLPVDTPFSATFTATTVPEPSARPLTGVGLLGILGFSLIARRNSPPKPRLV